MRVPGDLPLAVRYTPLVAAHYGWTASFLVAAAMALCGSLAWLPVDPECRLTVS
jgi:membrane-bound metal-dependent hydrolase YbcI (DUF457 family)